MLYRTPFTLTPNFIKKILRLRTIHMSKASAQKNSDFYSNVDLLF
jgi:hypothetical protein